MLSVRLERLRSAPLIRPLSSPDFRTFWLGEPLVSSLGDQISLIALTWLALELTGSGVALGLVLTATAIPRAILMLVGGVASDRWSPRSIMLVTNAVRGVVTALLGLLVLTGGLQFWELIVLAGLFGVMDAFFFPASGTIVPGIVAPERLEAANALSQGTMQLMGLIGPALGGIIVAAFTTAPAFLIDAVTFGVAVLALLRVHYARPVGSGADPAAASAPAQPAAGSGSAASNGLLGTIRAGFRYAWGDPGLRAVLLIIAAIDFAFAGSVGVGVPWLADTRFGGAVDFGLMLAGWSGGALVGAGVAGSVGQLPRLGTILIGVLVAMGLGLALVGVAPLVGLVVLIMAGMGVGGGFVNVLAVAWLQRKVDPSMLGRVMSLVMLFSMGLAPVSYAISGPFVQASPPLFFLVAGLLVAGAALAGAASGAPGYFEVPPASPTPQVSVAGDC
jgi:Major Facilitator Superfamily